MSIASDNDMLEQFCDLTLEVVQPVFSGQLICRKK